MSCKLKIILPLCLLALPLPGVTQTDSLWVKASNLYAEGKYTEATEAYTAIVSSSRQSFALFFNMGNAYYKQGELAKAILYYERAQRLSPDDDDVAYNLELANSQTVDKIEPLPEFFLVTWLRAVKNMLTIGNWAWVSITCFAVGLLLLLLSFFGRSGAQRKLAFFSAIVILAASLTSFYISLSEKRQYEAHAEAIIMSGVVSVKAAPDNTSVDLFILHEGAKVKVLEFLSGWKKIKTADGNQGWIPQTSAEAI
ncbi:MAG: tetratricopeptide repeat protein [Prevotellaceae bacterium]|jgi:tetratricopeptide (TPR) repeat protein|nr:tetratricopeptide repeat protein [Prevotellaceae bacterium]